MDELTIYTKAADIWEVMYADCAKAQSSIEFEQYILMDDAAGQRFLDLFIEKAKAGVLVRLMLDSIGSRDLLLSPRLSALREAGGVVHFFNPIRMKTILSPRKWLPRNHVKTLLIDGKLGYTGSACMWDMMRDWHDVQARFTGALADEVKRYFIHLWAEAEFKPMPSVPFTPVSGGFSYVVTQFGVRPNRIYRELLRGIDAAKKSVCIVTPYFLPPWMLRHALRRAVRRGVDVRVMVSEKSDVGIADYVSRSYYPPLFRAGVRIFHYQPTVLHAKYVVIDDSWATIGSTNMDYLSLMQNREANIFADDLGVAAKISADFEACLKDCVEVNMAYYRRLGGWKRTLGFLGRGMRRIL